MQLAYVDQSRDDLDPKSTVWKEISGGQDIVLLGKREINSRQYTSWFNFRGGDQQKPVGQLSGGERNRVHLAKLLKSGGNVLLLDEPTNDLDVDTLRALEEALLDFAGCAVVITHDRWFLDRVATHILAFEGDSQVTWFEGDWGEYADVGRRDARPRGARAAPDQVQASRPRVARARERERRLGRMANPTQHRLTAVEVRVLGSLLEKQRTTPDQYPLSLNALRLACNQATSREPVMSLDEDEVREAVRSLANAGWARLASGTGSRVAKYRQLLDESLDLLPSESALLAVLLLRGPQTVNELRARAERAHAFAGNDDVAEALARLATAELVRELPRASGQREARWTHLLAGEERAAPTLEDVIDAYNEAWNRHDLEGIVALHAPGMVFQNHNAGELAEGDAVRGHIAQIFENWPDLRFTGRSLYVGDSFVVQEWTAHATHPSGTELTWEGVDIFPFKGGQILRKDVYSNASRRVPEQLGG